MYVRYLRLEPGDKIDLGWGRPHLRFDVILSGKSADITETAWSKREVPNAVVKIDQIVQVGDEHYRIGLSMFGDWSLRRIVNEERERLGLPAVYEPPEPTAEERQRGMEQVAEMIRKKYPGWTYTGDIDGR